MSANYTLRRVAGSDEIVTCDCCRYPAPLADFEKANDRSQVWSMCQICASTALSKAVEYPRLCPDPSLLTALGWIANHLLTAIRSQAAHDNTLQ